MSIRGIDTQIMITRTADMARETSALQRNPQFSQELMAARQIQESAENQSRVIATEEAEMENIKTDADGSGSGASGGGGKGESEQEQQQEQERELLVAPADHDQIIDIVV